VINFYVTPSPSLLRIYVTLKECELIYREHYVDVWRGEQFTPAFYAVNSLGKVPVIVDNDGSESDLLHLSESCAIMLYPTQKCSSFLPVSCAAAAACVEWLTFAVGTLRPMFRQYNHFRQFATEQSCSLSRYCTKTRRIYRVVEARIATMPYLGGEYSVANMAAYACLFIMKRQYAGDADRVTLPERPMLTDWAAWLAIRPAVGRAQNRFLAFPSSLSLADAAQLDRVFGRGAYASQPLSCFEEAQQ